MHNEATSFNFGAAFNNEQIKDYMKETCFMPKKQEFVHVHITTRVSTRDILTRLLTNRIGINNQYNDFKLPLTVSCTFR